MITLFILFFPRIAEITYKMLPGFYTMINLSYTSSKMIYGLIFPNYSAITNLPAGGHC